MSTTDEAILELASGVASSVNRIIPRVQELLGRPEFAHLPKDSLVPLALVIRFLGPNPSFAPEHIYHYRGTFDPLYTNFLAIYYDATIIACYANQGTIIRVHKNTAAAAAAATAAVADAPAPAPVDPIDEAEQAVDVAIKARNDANHAIVQDVLTMLYAADKQDALTKALRVAIQRSDSAGVAIALEDAIRETYEQQLMFGLFRPVRRAQRSEEFVDEAYYEQRAHYDFDDALVPRVRACYNAHMPAVFAAYETLLRRGRAFVRLVDARAGTADETKAADAAADMVRGKRRAESDLGEREHERAAARRERKRLHECAQLNAETELDYMREASIVCIRVCRAKSIRLCGPEEDRDVGAMAAAAAAEAATMSAAART